MKKSFTILVAVLLTVTLWAQSPQKMSYQAVIRDASDNLVTNQDVGMQISILQGSTSGTAVYVETQTPTTNANGLVSLEIGTGTTSDDFSTIDWTDGLYFIKTETDPAGGSTYTITGTSQLLSVPYALHSKTAETITGTINETDPVYIISEAANITATHITNLGNLSGTNAGDQSISRTGLTVTLTNGGAYQDSVNTYTAGTGIDITNNIISTTGAASLAIGDSYGGGIIFWLDASGQHGLIAATEDQSAGIQWYNGSNISTDSDIDAVYGGISNTTNIINVQGVGSYAAQVCDDYSVTVNNEYYDDWYLPSIYELNLLYLQKDVVGGFLTSPSNYWSSLEVTFIAAWFRSFVSDYTTSTTKDELYRVRAIRAF